MAKGGKRKPGPEKTLDRNIKPKSEKKQPYATRLWPDQKRWLNKQPNAAREIEQALDDHIAKKGKEE
jgi:hypothetical protein